MSIEGDRRIEITRLAEEVMDIVAEVAGRRLAQALQVVNDDRIEPLREALRNCHTINPSLMDVEACQARLKEINRYVYRVLERS